MKLAVKFVWEFNYCDSSYVSVFAVSKLHRLLQIAVLNELWARSYDVAMQRYICVVCILKSKFLLFVVGCFKYLVLC
jgi:hypothetical protein